MQKKQKQLPVRLPQDLYEELARWAEYNFRSINSEIVFIIRDELNKRHATATHKSEAKANSDSTTNSNNNQTPQKKPTARTATKRTIDKSFNPSPILLPANRLLLDSAGLSPKQEQVAIYMLGGMSYHEIANRLGVDRATVRYHAEAILKKFKVNSREEWEELFAKTEAKT